MARLRLIKELRLQKGFQTLGETLIVSEEVNEICEECMCQLSGSKDRSVSDLHYDLLCAKKMEINSYLLPPSKLSFQE